jgi:ribonuclease-3
VTSEPPAARYNEFLAQIGARPAAADLFRCALTHRSWIHEAAPSAAESYPEANERLEFLGDAVLGLVIARRLYERLPLEDEGQLSKAKSSLVSAEVLARHARRLELGALLRLGRGEDLSGGRARESLLADALEAVIGALFLAEGLPAAEALILSLWTEDLEREVIGPGDRDYKSLLQEASQKLKRALPMYHVEQVLGPDHDRIYEMSASIADREYGRGSGRSKKEAAQAAAAAALTALKKESQTGGGR